MTIDRFRLSRRGLFSAGAATTLAGASLSAAPAAEAAEAAQAAVAPAHRGRIREYWIQADSFQHNLVPTGTDQMTGTMFKPSDSTFWAIGYRAYTPGWKHLLPSDSQIGPNTGIPGPTIRAEVGDTVLVHFRNNDTHYAWPHSMHTHGFKYTPASDGGFIAAQPNQPGRAVKVGESYTYTWTAVESSVGTWPYHDHSMAQGMGDMGPTMEMGAELGLLGIVAITDRHTPRVDREFVLFFHDLYQADVKELSQDYDCFNGAAYLGNTPTFTARLGERVRWRVAALGKEFHVFHVHGHRWRDASGQFVDAQILGPSTTLTVEFTEDNPGDWLYHCHVTDHMAGGMVGRYLVH
jgi:manganese oxidase